LDLWKARLEARAAAKELAIVPDPVEADLTTGAPQLIEEAARYRVLLRAEVPRGGEAVAPLDLEQGRDLLDASL